ncbi:MAG: hypothetical protein ACTHMS_03400 [Jatrophihabitans sp.]|uniref:hypothetical protein n=1 Tax=Jatrophihabitans sp. TaxID=1932789 RepID=UPI003F81749A
MILGAAFVPQTPLLVPAVAQGAAADLTELTEAARTAIRRVGDGATRWLVVGAADAAAAFPAGAVGTLAGFGVPVTASLGRSADEAPTLPASLTVGTWVLADAVGELADVGGLADDPSGHAPAVDLDGATALLVVGDGSAKRTEKAPGYFDPRAEAFDAAVAEMLGAGDPRRLAEPQAQGGAELMAAGAPVWAQVAGLLGDGTFTAELLHDSAPFGVGYFVAAWTARA